MACVMQRQWPMKTRFPAVMAALAVAGLLAGCGEATEVDVVATAGEPLVLPIDGPVSEEALPPGAIVDQGAIWWTPSREHVGEHVIALDDGTGIRVTVHESTADGEAPIHYGGCECGSLPKPPRPRGEGAAPAAAIAVWLTRRRAALRGS